MCEQKDEAENSQDAAVQVMKLVLPWRPLVFTLIMDSKKRVVAKPKRPNGVGLPNLPETRNSEAHLVAHCDGAMQICKSARW